jgi:ADP-ribosyl-[dinitrogen reductase] hydrolase
MTIKTSHNCPLEIGEVQVKAGQGFLGLTLCPGKKDEARNWGRDLGVDLQVIKKWGASTVVTLIEDHEFAMLQVEALGQNIRAMGIDWIHLPIVDVSVPDQRFKTEWVTQGPKLHKRLDAGDRILIHCRGGIGRTGLVAGVLLAERGVSPKNAIEQVRKARLGTIETRQQENYVLSTLSSWS